MKVKHVSLLAILLMSALTISGCGQDVVSTDTTQEMQAVNVNVAKVTKTTVESSVTLNGKLQPAQHINVVPKMAGKVNSIKFDVGDNVKKGDALFTLEDKDIRLQVQQAAAGLKMAQVGLTRTKGSGKEQQLTQLNTALTQAETNYTNANKSYERMKELYDQGVISEQQLEQTESQKKIAEEQYNAAKSSLELTESKVQPESIATAQAQLQQAQAAYDTAKSALDNTIITSPITGVIATNNVKIGEFATNASVAMSVIDNSYMTVEVDVPENAINKINLNDSVNVLVNTVSDKPLKGEIMTISPIANSRTQSYPVKIKIANDSGLLKGGMFAEIKIIADKAENALAVPLISMVTVDGKNVVYVVNGEKAEKREIQIGFINEEYAQVTQGLEEGEVIVIKGQNYLTDGSKLTVVE